MTAENHIFKADYRWTDKKGREISNTSPIGILKECGFTTSDYVNASKKNTISGLSERENKLPRLDGLRWKNTN